MFKLKQERHISPSSPSVKLNTDAFGRCFHTKQFAMFPMYFIRTSESNPDKTRDPVSSQLRTIKQTSFKRFCNLRSEPKNKKPVNIYPPSVCSKPAYISLL